MNDEQERKTLLEGFGKAVARIHERQSRNALRDFLAIDNPKNDNDVAMSKYYSDMPPEEVVAKICQHSIEGVLHDLFFLFEENENWKLILKTESGSEIDLAAEYEELRAKPLDWVEDWSAQGLEGGRQVKFYSDYYGLGLA